MKHNILRTALAAAAAASLLLAACGGGGGDAAPAYAIDTAAAPPDTAAASSSGFLGFITDMAGAMLDSRGAFDLTAFNLPTDNADTLEPARTSIDQ